jgi:SAM-dependent methyltransferase
VTLSDRSRVRTEYADESRLAVRKRAHELGEGPDACEIVLAAVRDGQPRRVLDVGCGEGELAERVLNELGVEVVAIDQSPRMVELTRRRGVDARVGDVQALDFARHFSSVQWIDARGWLVFPGPADAEAYVDSMLHLEGTVVPEVDGPMRVRRTPSVFVCTK